MELYDLLEVDGWGEQFATCARAEPIRFEDPDEECDICLMPFHRRRVGPFTIVWKPGSDVIPDFLFGYHGEFMVTDQVKTAFEEADLKGYIAWPVGMKPPPERKKRKLPIVPWPYTGPRIWDIHITDIVDLVAEKSTVRFTSPCATCGRVAGTPVGKPEKWSLVVDRNAWSGNDFLRPRGVSTILITERVADVIEKNGFTNVIVRRVGEIAG